MSVHLAVRAAC